MACDFKKRREQRIGKVNERRRRAPILREKELLAAGLAESVPEKIEDLDIGAAESIDRLFGIADEEETVLSRCPQKLDEPALGVVEILKFVDEDMGEESLVASADI